ncbi:hypothetical protein [Lutibacter maritimus]|uniref:Uncharacterized protein n=1 Tax=Lutibacter maritimus TaxID=593133 RepID=A0A1I6QN42_9FLAO|nr:hypothetical protein [Lutibacter maritimus]SFS53887.1 hypothetical protein SAMN04488006_1941 [Lutibacter maritimus]
MKYLTKLTFLLLAIFLISCEKETAITPESNEIQDLQIQSNIPITTLIAEGIDLKTYFKQQSTIKTFESRATIQQPDDMAVIYFYYDADDFDCNLIKEDFEEFKFINDGMPSFLDEFTDSRIFSPGDILPGITFEAIDHLGYEENHDTSNGLFICNWNSMPNVLMSNYWNTDLVIRFKNDNVTEVSMSLYNLLSTDVNISVFGIDDTYLGMTTVYNQQYFARYLAMSALQPIKKVVISSDYYGGYEGVDFIGFGSCSDADNDGCPNAEDPYPNSIMTEKIVIDGIDTGVENTYENCGTMADEIQTILNQINSEFTGDNYYTLHKKFAREVSKLTYYWFKDRKITSKERTSIGNAIWNANIPYYTITE